MKKVFLSMFILAGLGLTACSGDSTEEQVAVENVVYTVDSEATTLAWTGHYLVNEELHHSHTGVVNVTSGSIVMNGSDFVEGSFSIDMLSMAEPNPENEEKGQYFISHMNSADYFNTAEFPQTTFTVTSLVDATMTGVLNVIGMELPIEFPVSIETSEAGLSAKGTFTIDIATLNLPGLQIDPENPDQRVSPKVDFNLDLVMTK